MGVKHFYRASNVAYKQQQQFWSISPKTIPARGWACHQWWKALCNNNLHILSIIITQEGHYVVIKHRNDSLLKFCCFRATRGPNGLRGIRDFLYKVPPIGYLDKSWAQSTVDFCRYVSTFADMRRLMSKNVDFCQLCRVVATWVDFGRHTSKFVEKCRFLSDSCRYTSIYVDFCRFLSIYVDLSCRFMSIYVEFWQCLSR